MSNQDLSSEDSTVLLEVDGMKCGACVQAVEKVLLGQSNVLNASVNLVSRTAFIDLRDSKESLDPIIEALEARGFYANRKEMLSTKEVLSSDLEYLGEWWRQWRELMVALVLLLLSVLGHLAEGGALRLPLLGALPFHAALATVALLGPGLQILSSGFRSAIAFSPTMDTLVGLGVGSSYLASLVALIWPDVGWPCFFNEPVMLLGFVLLGRFLEERARFRTGRALKQLANLQPDKARLLLDNESIREVRVGALRPGEKIQLLAGDRVPVDGVVINGSSAVDISSLTGEPLPIQASPGKELVSGSLNLEATLVLEVQRVGADTALARIIGLVEQAQARKAPIQRLADLVAGRFCYGVVALSILTFVFWWRIGARIWPEVLSTSSHGLLHVHSLHQPLGGGAETPLGLSIQLAIAVLVVACPCALGLATPTVITVASGQAARHGWLFRGGDVIEMAASLKQLVFDKTGTLTVGRPMVSELIATKNSQRMLLLAASLEQSSRHPLANAVLQEAEKNQLKLLSCKSSFTFAGEGICGELEGVRDKVRVGTPEWLQSQGVSWTMTAQTDLERAVLNCKSVIAVAEGNKLLGFVLIEDQLRPQISFTLDTLRKQGFELSLMSGDRKEAVQLVGQKLNFLPEQLGWQLLPSEKLERLKILSEKSSVGMVGDGINDAPALAAADLGIAIGTGTQIAQESADLVLLGDCMESLPEAFYLARRTMAKVRQNLGWAFGYNLIALPIAAGVLLPGFGLLLSPPIAALLLAMSSITVVVNALLLRDS